MKKGLITQNNILVAAEKVFSEKGLYGARIDEIAACSGCNKRMIYEHFGSKEGLYTAVLNAVYSRLSVSESALLEKKYDTIETIRHYIRHLFNFLKDNPTFVKMVMWENLNEAKYIKESGAANLKSISVEFLKSVLKKGIDEGIFKKDIDINEVIVAFNMFCFSCFSNIYTMTNIMDIDFFNNDELEKRCDFITGMILDYIMA